MTALLTTLAGLALAGATTFGVITSQADQPSGSLPTGGVTYDAGK